MRQLSVRCHHHRSFAVFFAVLRLFQYYLVRGHFFRKSCVYARRYGRAYFAECAVEYQSEFRAVQLLRAQLVQPRYKLRSQIIFAYITVPGQESSYKVQAVYKVYCWFGAAFHSVIGYKKTAFRRDRYKNIAGAGFEPAISRLWALRDTGLLYPAILLYIIRRDFANSEEFILRFGVEGLDKGSIIFAPFGHLF